MGRISRGPFVCGIEMNKHAITDNIKKIYERINRTALRAGREPDDIKLIAVTKTIGIERIKEAIDSGLRVFGENRVQEAQRKISDFGFRISDFKIEWHLIGPLQKNKAKYAVRLFDLIHSVDSVELAEEVNRQADKIGKIQRILVQVKLSEEETKHGVSEEGLEPLLKSIQALNNLKLEGLMTMPPFFDNPEKARPLFKRLKEIRDRINSLLVTRHPLLELSIGMSNDFEVAMEEGSTMVRIGSAIFGARQ